MGPLALLCPYHLLWILCVVLLLPGAASHWHTERVKLTLLLTADPQNLGQRKGFPSPLSEILFQLEMVGIQSGTF